MNSVDISRLSDEDLLAGAKALAADERAMTCDLVEYLAEIDDRRLAIELGYTSLLVYCVEALSFSEAAAYRRIRAARAIRLFPPIAVLLRNGGLTLESIAHLHPHLEDEDAAALVQQATGMRTWEVERLVSTRQPPGPERDVLRFVGPPIQQEPPRRDEIDSGDRPEAEEAASPLAPIAHAVRIAFTADDEFYRLLQRAREVMRHKYPDGRLHGILRDALDALLDKKDMDRRVRRPSRADRG